MEQFVIRPVRTDEWQKVKALRLEALADPLAPMAFLESVEDAAAKPDAYWQERARGAAKGVHLRQFIAETPDGQWVGSVSAFVEPVGGADFLERTVDIDQGHLVGVYVRPEWRGRGLTDALFAAALDWAWSLEEPRLERVRLFVHEDNARAGGFYRRYGFRPSGLVIPKPGDPAAKELEYVFRRPAPAARG
ncbi:MULTISPECIES: GNAT family N-acetyltransferase [Streptomyces]|uniref:GNAT family N-acetyltransferase n=1 Tax=Streptomyces TaxID=1883 RepID=UPI001679C758|nr:MULTISPECIES: GNAT family N-acetyltransferase [Streptomyces]MBD3577293.1 N-acetyltransferase [Streptomyces sp. KD18]